MEIPEFNLDDIEVEVDIERLKVTKFKIIPELQRMKTGFDSLASLDSISKYMNTVVSELSKPNPEATVRLHCVGESGGGMGEPSWSIYEWCWVWLEDEEDLWYERRKAEAIKKAKERTREILIEDYKKYKELEARFKNVERNK